jgi:hypothetical protein
LTVEPSTAARSDLDTRSQEDAVAKDRAVFWMSVVLLLGVGILLGQIEAVMIAAMAAIILAYQNDRIPRS